MLWAVIGFFSLIVLIDLIPLIKKRKWFAVAAFSCVFTVAFILAIFNVYKIEFPSILKTSGDFLRRIGLSYSP